MLALCFDRHVKYQILRQFPNIGSSHWTITCSIHVHGFNKKKRKRSTHPCILFHIHKRIPVRGCNTQSLVDKAGENIHYKVECLGLPVSILFLEPLPGYDHHLQRLVLHLTTIPNSSHLTNGLCCTIKQYH